MDEDEDARSQDVPVEDELLFFAADAISFEDWGQDR